MFTLDLIFNYTSGVLEVWKIDWKKRMSKED